MLWTKAYVTEPLRSAGGPLLARIQAADRVADRIFDYECYVWGWWQRPDLRKVIANKG